MIAATQAKNEWKNWCAWMKNIYRNKWSLFYGGHSLVSRNYHYNREKDRVNKHNNRLIDRVVRDKCSTSAGQHDEWLCVLLRASLSRHSRPLLLWWLGCLGTLLLSRQKCHADKALQIDTTNYFNRQDTWCKKELHCYDCTKIKPLNLSHFIWKIHTILEKKYNTSERSSLK